MTVEDGWRLEEILLGDFQHRFDLRFDSRFPGDFIGCIQQVRYFIDVGGDKTRQHAVGVRFRQLDCRVQMRSFVSS